MMPFAEPLRIKSAWMCSQPHPLRKEPRFANLFDTVDEGIVDVIGEAVTQREFPWQLWLVEIMEQANGEILEGNVLVVEAGAG
jgi:hypothetical protein